MEKAFVQKLTEPIQCFDRISPCDRHTDSSP